MVLEYATLRQLLRMGKKTFALLLGVHHSVLKSKIRLLLLHRYWEPIRNLVLLGLIDCEPSVCPI